MILASIPPDIASDVAWASLAAWVAVAMPFFVTSVVVHFWTRGLLARALETGNGKILTARRRLQASRWYLLGSGTALFLGLFSVWVVLNLPLPPPDTRIANAVSRFGVCFILLSFFMTKVHNFLTFTDFERASRAVLERAALEARDEIKDTNARVREMQEQGKADHPLEEADRQEGRTHREEMHEALRDAREDGTGERRDGKENP